MELNNILESILFAASKPLSVKELKSILTTTAEQNDSPETQLFKNSSEQDIVNSLNALAQEYTNLNRSFQLVCVAGAWQLVSKPEFAPWLRIASGERIRPPKLSQPALETLAIIAYRQPITKAEIEEIRGVSVDGVIQTLLERELIVQVGKAEVIGRPALYGTTPAFLEYFGLASLDDLPDAPELRRIITGKSPSLQDSTQNQQQQDQNLQNTTETDLNAQNQIQNQTTSP
jgi:segregation and condensation protein B